MAVSRYELVARRVLALSVVLMLLGQLLADRLYQHDRLRGWQLGIAALALPALSLGAVAWWIRVKRRHDPAAHVKWLGPTVGVVAVLWILVLIFPLL